MQRWVVYKPVPSLLVGGAETVHNSGVGDCSEILNFDCQYGMVTLEERLENYGKKNGGTVWAITNGQASLKIAARAIGGLFLRFSEYYQPAEAGEYGSFSVSVPGGSSCAC